MNESTEYDVIVVGGGPAGSTAGYILSNFGLKVLIVDKSKFPRQKLCAGCIADKTIKLLDRVFGQTVNDLKKENIINFESDHYEIFYKNKLVDKKNITIPFRFVDRYIYDDFLLRKTQQAGAEVIEGEGVTYFDLTGNSITTSTGRTLKAKFFIGADGINSVMRRSFPKEKFDQRHWLDNMATALEIFVNRSEVKKQINHPILYFDFISHGYSWVFPNRDKLIVGMGGLIRKNKKQFLPSFHKFFSALDMGKVETSRMRGCAFPYGNFLLEPVYRNVILVGDAAGFADPLFGEGIFYAQRSAELASQAIYKAVQENNNPEKTQKQIAATYFQLLQKNIYTEFIYAGKIRILFHDYLNKFNYYPIKILMNILGIKLIEAIHGIRSYRWLRKLPEE